MPLICHNFILGLCEAIRSPRSKDGMSMRVKSDVILALFITYLFVCFQVHLKKGHSLRINKGGRNVLVLDKNCQKSATNFIRKTLVQIYGKEQLAQMTVMGRKKNSLSISPADMSAIYGKLPQFFSINAVGVMFLNFSHYVQSSYLSTRVQ